MNELKKEPIGADNTDGPDAITTAAGFLSTSIVSYPCRPVNASPVRPFSRAISLLLDDATAKAERYHAVVQRYALLEARARRIRVELQALIGGAL